MTLDIQFKIKSDKNYEHYLKENSYWYKYLNRNPSYFSEFEEEMKKTYRLRPSDKIENFVNTLELIQKFMSIM